MTDLVNFGCTPVAATNLLKYYYLVNKTKYRKLMDLSWKQTYYDLRYYMKTNSETGGTSDKNAVAGYIDYISIRGYNVSANLVKGTDNGLKVAKELKKSKKPIHLQIRNHYIYENHSVIAVGYQTYKYSGILSTKYQTYILIADGHKSGYPTRYIWGGCSGYWNYITVSIS